VKSASSVNPRYANPQTVLVFSTSVDSAEQVRLLAPALNSLVGQGRWNFALDDSDRILRIVSSDVQAVAAIHLLRDHGFDCVELED
jgi:hypothetical protein